MPVEASVLTLVRGRSVQLRHLMQGLAAQTVRPRDLVIAWMQPEPEADLPDPGCPVRHIHVPGEKLPLAAARNRAAEAARTELLVFLDVDCVPGPVSWQPTPRPPPQRTGSSSARSCTYRRAQFLRPAFTSQTSTGSDGTHPAKPAIPAVGLRLEPDPAQLWGLSFALPAAAWGAVGGMDETFEGYGGEETDLALRLAAQGLPTFWVAGARAYHQHHPVHVPPLQHFDSILANAARFQARHGRWCMDYWLGQFRDAGLIAWDATAPAIHTIRRPSADEIAAALRPDALFS